MSQTAIVVEDGVIQCEHGGKVVLKSSVANHVIGGKKPLHDIDLMGAVIQNCPYYAPVGGNCTSVASITSAVTEANVASQGKNYLLRVDGCKTDKGAALVLVDPGQTNSTVKTKSDGSAGNITDKELEDAKVDTKENIKNEKYRIHPLRKSNGKIRALRGARDFQVLKNFHFTNDYTHEKIITKTDAYLYVTHDNQTTEYKVINRGDTSNPIMHKIQYKDTKTNIIRRHIPFYEETGELEFVYSNVKLTDAQTKEFPSIKIKVEDKKNACVIHPKVYSKAVQEDIKVFKKKELKAGVVKAASKTRAYISTLLYMDDPIGEVEDLYNDYEFSYHCHYGMNKGLIDDIQAKNQYPYAIADMLDYLYVSDTEKQNYNQQRDALQEQYKRISEQVTTDMAKYIESYMKGKNLIPAMEYKIAKEYYDELRFLDNEFFQGNYSFSIDLSDGKHTHTTNRHFHGKRLMLSSTKYKEFKDNPRKTLAFLTFSVCYGEKYKDLLTPELKEESEKFYYLLKNATPLPQMNEKSLEEISDEMKYQEEYKKICSGEDPLLDEFEQLDITLKEIAFDPKKAQNKLYAKNKYGFNSLKIGSTRSELFYNKNLGNPKEIAKKIASALASSDLADILKQYQTIQAFENEDEEHNFHHNLINLTTMLMAPRAELDRETAELSVFNHDNVAIKELVRFITEKLNGIGQEKAEKLHEEPIKTYYLNALYRLITHAKLAKVNESFPERKAKGKLKIVFMESSFKDKGREDNATAFLKAFEQSVPKQEIKTDKPLDNNFDKDLKIKTESEKLYTSLKQLDGVTSYLDKIDGTIDDMDNRERALDDFRQSSKYKKLLASSQVLSFFITIGKISEYIQGKEKLKIHNLIGVSGDILSVANDMSKVAELKLKHLPQKLEHIVTPKKMHSLSSMKVIARFGLIGAMANAANDAANIDKSTNEDLYYSTNAKNAIYIALMFTPAWIALGGIALTELAWFFLKDKIENSSIELYLYKSLLFNTSSHNKHQWFNDQEGVGYKASIFIETLTASNSRVQVEHFTSLHALRDFIAKTHESEPQVIKAAMRNELSQLKSIVHGINLSINEDKKLFASEGNEHYHAYGYVTLSKRLADNQTHVVQLHNGTPLEEQQVFEIDDDKNIVYNTVWDNKGNVIEALGNMDPTEIIIATKELALKYKVVYEYNRSPYGNELSKKLYINKLEIKELKVIPMTDDDYKFIQ